MNLVYNGIFKKIMYRKNKNFVHKYASDYIVFIFMLIVCIYSYFNEKNMIIYNLLLLSYLKKT